MLRPPVRDQRAPIIPLTVTWTPDERGIAVGGQRERHALAGGSHSARADELLALLRPATTTAGEHPHRAGPVMIRPAPHHNGVAIGGQCDRGALAGHSNRTQANELLALRRPDTTTAGEHPRSLRPPPTHNSGVAVGGQRDRRALAER